MNYIRVDILTNSQGSDLLVALLWDVAENGIIVKDDKDYKEAVEKSIYEDCKLGQISDIVIVTLFINNIQKLDEIKKIINELDKNDYGKLTLTSQEYVLEDYDKQWKSFHKPIELNKIVIIPEWYDLKFAKPILKININSSFGTGQHDSTKLALQMIESIDLKGKTVIDLGCGSGILGLSALILGADYSYMLDIDDIDNAEYNCKINNLEHRCIIEKKDLTQCNYKADIIIVNIYASVLCEHKDKIISLIKDKGILILSGIYKESIDEIMKVYKDLKLLRLEKTDDWSALILERV